MSELFKRLFNSKIKLFFQEFLNISHLFWHKRLIWFHLMPEQNLLPQILIKLNTAYEVEGFLEVQALLINT